MVSNELFSAAVSRIEDLLPRARISIIALGDFYQLKPVRGHFVFKNSFWCENFQFLELDKNWRCKDDPIYTALLQRVRVGILTQEDVDLLGTRVVDTATVTKLISEGIPAFCCEHEQCEKLNKIHLECACILRDKTDVLEPIDRVGSAKKQDTLDPDHVHFAGSREGNRMKNTSPTFLNAPDGAVVMLTTTLDLDDGLVNGTKGIVVGRERNQAGDVLAIHFAPLDPVAGRNSKVGQGGADYVRIMRREISFIGKRGQQLGGLTPS